MNTAENLTFETLVERYRESLTRAAYHLCRDREACHDIVQETLIDAYRGFAGLREPDNAGAWLYAILRRKAIVHYRTRRNVVELTKEPCVAGPEDTQTLIRSIILDQMSKLSESDREILAGKYLLGLSYKELAESLQVKEGTIRVRCLRARDRLEVVLRGAGIEMPEKR